MRDIEDLLRHKGLKPRRQLSSNFTNEITTRLKNGERPEPRPWWKEFIPMKFRNMHKPAIAGAACMLVLVAGGTTYAAVNGWSVQTMFGGQKDLGNGQRIVKVDAKNCPHVDAFNITNKNRSRDASYYYRVASGVNLTNDQVVDIVTTTCEADAEGAANSPTNQAIRAMLAKPENVDKVVGGYGDAIIAALTPTSITIQFPTGGLNTRLQGTTTQHFTQIDPAVLVTNGPALSTYSALKVGDHVFVQYRASGDALNNSETISPDKVDASQQVVVGIQKLSPAMQKYFEESAIFSKYRKDIEQVAPCTSQPSGYCTDAEYLGQ